MDTYRPADIEKLGVRNATDLLTNLPQEMGTTVNQNTTVGQAGGDGAVIPNLRGLLPKETLVLIDGKRVAIDGFGGAISNGFSSPGVDINLIPFPMIDHIDILKDGASAVYGSDAVAGVINFFLLHKFRGLEIGGSIGNTNMGASNDARELEGWLKAGTGDDKTDILVIADFYDRAAIYSRDRDIESNAFGIPWGTVDFRNPVFSWPGSRSSPLDPEIVFQCELSAAALSAERCDFSILYPRRFPAHFEWTTSGKPQCISRSARVSSVRNAAKHLPQTGHLWI